ncbi:hypothetical protein SFRURICE_010514, partial [Spodoptera frugiperda]
EQLPKCKLSDNECKRGLIESALRILAKTGLPEKGIPKIDPFSIHNVSLSIPDVIDLTLVDGRVKGIKDCAMNKFTASIEDEHASLEMTCDITIKGQYKVFSDLAVKLLMAKEMEKFDFDYFFQNRDGQVFIKCKNDKLKYNYDVKGKMVFYADNLFIGGKESSKSVMDVMNQNWKFLMTTFGKPFMDKSTDFIMEFLQKLFDVIPANNMFEDDLSKYARDE